VIDLSAVCTENPRSRILIGVPFFLLVVLVAPVLVLLSPLASIACLVVGVDPFRAARLVWGVMTAFRGTHVEVTQRNRTVLVHLS
jgi:hypothetical protein